MYKEEKKARVKCAKKEGRERRRLVKCGKKRTEEQESKKER